MARELEGRERSGVRLYLNRDIDLILRQLKEIQGDAEEMQKSDMPGSVEFADAVSDAVEAAERLKQ